jgi:hypothetical protein
MNANTNNYFKLSPETTTLVTAKDYIPLIDSVVEAYEHLTDIGITDIGHGDVGHAILTANTLLAARVEGSSGKIESSASKSIETLASILDAWVDSQDTPEEYDRLPPVMADLCDRYMERYEEEDPYVVVKEMFQVANSLGWTFDYYLDAIPYGFKLIGEEESFFDRWLSN